MEGFLGAIFLEYVGAFVVWIIKNIRNRLAGRKEVKFIDILSPDEDDPANALSNGMKNRFVAIGFLMSIVLIILFFGW
ncbi:MAG: hypothetical protein AAF693_12905 [Bacteroidota bacterium]